MSHTPDWNVTILNKATEERGRVGVAWDNPDGSIGIVLNPCVVLTGSPDLVITLFKRDKRPNPYARKQQETPENPETQPNDAT